MGSFDVFFNVFLVTLIYKMSNRLLLELLIHVLFSRLLLSFLVKLCSERGY